MKKIMLCITGVLVCQLLWGQTSQRVESKDTIRHKFVVNNDTIRCENAGWSLGGKLVCDGQRTDIKKENIQYWIQGTSIYKYKSIDPFDPNGKKDFVQINVPNILLTDSARVAVAIIFLKERSYEHNGRTYYQAEYEKKPACFKYVSDQIMTDLVNMNITPLLFVNYGEIEGSFNSIYRKAKTKCEEAGANTIFYFTFRKTPRNGAAEKGKVEMKDFKRGDLYIINESYFYSPYSYEGREGYTGMMRTFLEDFKNTEKR